jgi:Uma2 family endonuclease
MFLSWIMPELESGHGEEGHMSTHTEARLVTAAELLLMPEDGFRHELVRGELRTMAPAGSEHGVIAMNVGASLHEHVRAHGLGRVFAAETGFKLASNPDTVRAPDAAFVRMERVGEAGENGSYWPGPPDLAVEVVSPGDTYHEVLDKVLEWLEAGARMVIVIDPRRRVATVHHPRNEARILGEDGVIDGGDVLPGWRVALRELLQ